MKDYFYIYVYINLNMKDINIFVQEKLNLTKDSNIKVRGKRDDDAVLFKKDDIIIATLRLEKLDTKFYKVISNNNGKSITLRELKKDKVYSKGKEKLVPISDTWENNSSNIKVKIRPDDTIRIDGYFCRLYTPEEENEKENS